MEDNGFICQVESGEPSLQRRVGAQTVPVSESLGLSAGRASQAGDCLQICSSVYQPLSGSSQELECPYVSLSSLLIPQIHKTYHFIKKKKKKELISFSFFVPIAMSPFSPSLLLPPHIAAIDY